MKIQVSREGSAYVYKVSDRSGVSESELKSMYFEPDINGIYRRIYPASLMFDHDGQLLETNYNNYLLDKEKKEHQNDRNIIDNTIEWICNRL